MPVHGSLFYGNACSILAATTCTTAPSRLPAPHCRVPATCWFVAAFLTPAPAAAPPGGGISLLLHTTITTTHHLLSTVQDLRTTHRFSPHTTAEGYLHRSAVLHLPCVWFSHTFSTPACAAPACCVTLLFSCHHLHTTHTRSHIPHWFTTCTTTVPHCHSHTHTQNGYLPLPDTGPLLHTAIHRLGSYHHIPPTIPTYGVMISVPGRFASCCTPLHSCGHTTTRLYGCSRYLHTSTALHYYAMHYYSSLPYTPFCHHPIHTATQWLHSCLHTTRPYLPPVLQFITYCTMHTGLHTAHHYHTCNTFPPACSHHSTGRLLHGLALPHLSGCTTPVFLHFYLSLSYLFHHLGLWPLHIVPCPHFHHTHTTHTFAHTTHHTHTPTTYHTWGTHHFTQATTFHHHLPHSTTHHHHTFHTATLLFTTAQLQILPPT